MGYPQTLLGLEWVEAVRKLRLHRIRHGGALSFQEDACWEAALATPHGGTIIGKDDDPYMLRVYLMPKCFVPGFSDVYLHYFMRSDERNPHNHPCVSCTSRILTQGYKEFRLHNAGKPEQEWSEQVLLAGYENRLTRKDYHRIELLCERKGCWTVFVAGPRVPGDPNLAWGFFDLDKKEHIPWSQYEGQ